MNKAHLLGLFLFATTALTAQSNLSGTYGYQLDPPANTGNDKDAKGGSGKLVLLKMDGNKYRFWLDVSIGWPSYNTGETDGTITFVNDTASFDNTHEDAITPCMLRFKKTGNAIEVKSYSSAYTCGFADGVKAAGTYTWLSSQPALNNAWLRIEYYDAPFISITAAKAELFQDETFQHPFTKKQYLNKDDKVLAVAETENSYYTEFINPQGGFIYGWIKKSAAKKIGE